MRQWAGIPAIDSKFWLSFGAGLQMAMALISPNGRYPRANSELWQVDALHYSEEEPPTFTPASGRSNHPEDPLRPFTTCGTSCFQVERRLAPRHFKALRIGQP